MAISSTENRPACMGAEELSSIHVRAPHLPPIRDKESITSLLMHNNNKGQTDKTKVPTRVVCIA